ncbi:macrophage mannose receptor 1 [Plakobranchus ocellatus]|uniref:Macrophage mannose receptor 1 n=1 Tax=Plakobranchus ocellatus TaxID=259542 RepID=A0AAV4A1E8_9GAST|nr:macrophage mannose receptor 1 [Plakobranchus ocellatus]
MSILRSSGRSVDMLLAVMTVCFILASAGTASAQCDGAWESRLGGGSCYIFLDTLEYTWTEAQNKCREDGGFLVGINSKDEESYLAAGWVWDDGSPFSYFNWKPGQPDDRHNEDCAILNRTSMQWLDLKCELKLAAICEKHMQSDDSASSHMNRPVLGDGFYGCEAEWLPDQDSCYFFHEAEKTWTEAQLICRQDGADLVTISNEAENRFIWSQLPSDCEDRNTSCPSVAQGGKCPEDAAYTSFNCRKSCGLCDSACANAYTTKTCDYWASIGECTKNPFWMWPNCALSCGCDQSVNEGYWIGLNDRSSVMNFAWSDLSPVTFTYWMRQEPNNFRGKNEDCVLMHTLTGEWSDEICENPSSGFVCEKPKVFMDKLVIDAGGLGCPLGSVGYKGVCFTITSSPKSWSEARDYCVRMKGRLAVINDRKTNAFLAAKIFASESDSNFWIGLSATNEKYTWLDGSLPEFGAWTANHTGREMNMCASMTKAGQWNPDFCETMLPCVCERSRRGWKMSTPPTPPPVVASTHTPASCPPGWFTLHKHCYKVRIHTRRPLALQDGSLYTSTVTRRSIIFPTTLMCNSILSYPLRLILFVHFTWPSSTSSPPQLSTQRENWFQAQSVCESQGGSLVTIHDQATNDFLFTVLLSNKAANVDSGFWIGLRDSTVGGGFIWIDDSALDFQAWAYQQPNSFTLVESCGEALIESKRWRLENCHFKKPYVCQLERGGLYVSQAADQGKFDHDQNLGDKVIETIVYIF